MDMGKKKVALVGPYPPPYGGISVQISELEEYLLKNGYDCKVIDVGAHRRNGVGACGLYLAYLGIGKKMVCLAAKGYVIHLITNGHNLKSWAYALACCVACVPNGRKCIITLGSGKVPEYILKAGGLERCLIRVSTRLAGFLTVRNAASEKAIISVGSPSKKVAIMSGYFGISHIEEKEIPVDAAAFVSNHDPIIGAHVGPGPEYGTLLLLEGFRELKRAHQNAGLVLLGMNEWDAIRADNLRGMVKDVYCTGYLPHDIAINLMMRFDVFVRATYFDGDSKSVREASALGIPVVASDTAFRPQGVILFKIGDCEDMVSKLGIALKNIKEIRERAASYSSETIPTLKRITELYRFVSR
jgi:glycogen(starch) synthase